MVPIRRSCVDVGISVVNQVRVADSNFIGRYGVLQTGRSGLQFGRLVATLLVCRFDSVDILSIL